MKKTSDNHPRDASTTSPNKNTNNQEEDDIEGQINKLASSFFEEMKFKDHDRHKFVREIKEMIKIGKSIGP